MSDLDEVRRAHPEFNHLSDTQLAHGLYKSKFSHIPEQEYYKSIGFESPQFTPGDYESENEAFAKAIGRAPGNIANMATEIIPTAASAIWHPKDTMENLIYGLGQSGSNVASGLAKNIANYVKENQNKNVEYLQKHHPGLVQGYQTAAANPEELDILAEKLTASPEKQQSINRVVNSLLPEETEHRGAKLGQAVGKYIIPTAVSSAIGAPMLAPIVHGAIENKNVFEDIIPFLTAEKAGKYGIEKFPKALEKAKQGVDYIQKKEEMHHHRRLVLNLLHHQAHKEGKVQQANLKNL